MKKRKIDCREEISRHIYIFCEGTKTEPNYFQGIKNAIATDAVYKNVIQLNIIGTAKNTLTLIDSAMDTIEKDDIRNATIWFVYDKDSFPPSDFDNAQFKISEYNSNTKYQNEYYAAWSNQCIEYWFILHFDYYTADNHRSEYQKYLKQKFREKTGKTYTKNDKAIFQILCEHGNPKQAIEWAKKRIDDFDESTPPAKMAPATRVHLLIEELAKYLPQDVKIYFI
jgi:hypothetical protein